MLGKLLKYEFSSVAKTYLPIYGLAFLLAITNKVLMAIMPTSGFNLPQTIVMLIYVMILMTLMIVTFVTGVMRFKKNLLNDEGYLMMTLPVARWKLILSKAISATIWTVVSGTVGISSVVILAWDKDSTFNFRMTRQGELGLAVALIALIITVMLLGMMATYLAIYLSLAIGHMSSGTNKVAMSVLAYLGIGVSTQIIAAFVLVTGIKNSHIFAGISFAILPLVILSIFAILLLIYDIICFVGTSYIIKNKLNLE